IYSISFRNPKEIWVCTSDSGLGVFHIPSGTFRFRKQREEGEKNATKLIQSRQGVWFLLSSNRLFRYNPQNDLFHFEKMDVANTQSRTPLQIRRILSDPDYHALYMATDIGKGLVIYDSVRHQLISLPVETHPLSGDEFMRVWDIQKDAQNRYWVLSRDYIYELDRKNKKLKRLNTLFVQPARKYPTHKNFIRDQQQHLFVLSEDGHLFPLLPEEKMVTAWPVLPGQPSRILQAAFDLQNRCWILGPDSLGYLNPERTKFTLLSNPDLKIFQTNGINGFQSLQDGSIWISSLNKGLLKLWIDSAGHVQTKVWNMENGLPTQRIFSLKSDDKGNLWIPTVLGLVVLNPQTRQAQVYNHRNGIDRSSLQPMCSQAGPGIFYLSTEGKICQVNYHKLQDVSDSPQVYFYNFRVFNEERLLSRDEITLQPGENFFSIEFSCLDFLNQNRHNFSYQLIGWDKDWVSCGNRRYASYTNLNGGDYIFRVRVATPDGVWSKIRELKVHILTPFYKKNWFAAALIFIFAFVVFMLYLYRVRSIENTEKLKTEFNRQLAESRMAALRAQMNPHFIFNCLNSINRYVIKSEIKTASLYLTRFARLIRLILDNSENKFVVLSNELEALRLYIEMESLRFDQRFTFDIHVEENIETDQIEIPPLLIQPFVENAIWHGLLHRESEGHLQINLRLDDPFLVCEIIDNGIGREKAKEYKSKTAPTRKSLGMKLTEERLKMNSGPDSGSQKIVDLKDEHGLATGTMVILHIPI
ncbi:MAG TPA: histidine kinase, partial [Chitinophagaceae bacterium]|nr:histidine kinase [Chitinophagaceae bacterium]